MAYDVRLLGLVISTGAILAHLSCVVPDPNLFPVTPNMFPVTPNVPSAMEHGWDRPGSDYSFTHKANANQCQAACQKEAACKAWTFVKGPIPFCALKNAVPPAVANANCVSGVKSGGGGPSPGPTPVFLSFDFHPKAARPGQRVYLYLNRPAQPVGVFFQGRQLPKATLAGGQTLEVMVPGNAPPASSGLFELAFQGRRVRASEPLTILP
jgi:hypothetical protein